MQARFNLVLIDKYKPFLNLIFEVFPDWGYNFKSVKFRNAKDGASVLELVRYANDVAQKPLVKDELRFVDRYPEITKELLTMTPLNYPV